MPASKVKKKVEKKVEKKSKANEPCECGSGKKHKDCCGKGK
jgi:uncharacterized protein YchJ